MRKSGMQAIILFTTLLIFLLFVGMSIVYGYTDTTWKVAYQALTDGNDSTEHLVIQTVRLPRALIAAAVGSSLAIAGVLMQTLTKNPLASPGIFGVNAGAGFMVVIAVTLFNVSNLQSFTWLSFLGAGMAAVAVYVIGSSGREGLDPYETDACGSSYNGVVFFVYTRVSRPE